MWKIATRNDSVFYHNDVCTLLPFLKTRAAQECMAIDFVISDRKPRGLDTGYLILCGKDHTSIFSMLDIPEGICCSPWHLSFDTYLRRKFPNRVTLYATVYA